MQHPSVAGSLFLPLIVSLFLRSTTLFHQFSPLFKLTVFPFKSFWTHPIHTPLTVLNKRNNRKRDPPFPCPNRVWKVVQLYGGGEEGGLRLYPLLSHKDTRALGRDGEVILHRDFFPWQYRVQPYSCFPSIQCCHCAIHWEDGEPLFSLHFFTTQPPYDIQTQIPKCHFVSFGPGSNSICKTFPILLWLTQATRQVEFLI